MTIQQHTLLIPHRTPEEVFEFCLDGRNFQAIFPEPIRPVGKIDVNDLRISKGREFEFWHWMWHCVPVKWRVRIAEFEADRYYVDEMLRGPLRSFRHTHSVEAAPGGTLYTDRLEFRAHGGALMERLVVDGYMSRTFAARHRNMLSLLKPPP